MRGKGIALPLLAMALFTSVQLSAQICHQNTMVNFNFNEAELLPSETPRLDSLISVMAKTKEAYLEIYGHTDAKGTEEFNFKLANERIKAVKAYITGKMKGSSLSIKEYNFGEDRPLYNNQAENLASKNRRVELSFFPMDSGRITFKDGWASYSISKDYFAPCGVCGSHPQITQVRTQQEAQTEGIRLRDSLGRQLITGGMARFKTDCPDQKEKCPPGIVRFPASAFDKDMNIYVSNGEGKNMRWSIPREKLTYDRKKNT
jgi:hypothetical protein